MRRPETATMTYVSLGNLSSKQQSWNIKVKVVRMWESINTKTDELMSLDMILMDEEDNVIHCTIWKNLIETYKTQIKENMVYAIRNFKVQEATMYRPVDNCLKIVFIYNTSVKEIKKPSNRYPNHYFEFVTEDMLTERENKVVQCSDIIGLLSIISPMQQRQIMKDSSNPRIKDIREIELLLLDGGKARLTLWGDLAHYFKEHVIERATVIIVTSTMVLGQSFQAVSLKTTSATRLYKDLDIPETREVLNKYSGEESVPKILEIFRGTQGTIEEQMFHNRKTLQEISDIREANIKNKDYVFTSKATIIDLQPNSSWWYMACNSCNKICIKQDDKYYCRNCSDFPKKTTPRYWLRLQISDHSTSVTCTMFVDVAKKMLNTSVSDLLEVLQENTDDVPNVIQDLYGRLLVFQFKLNDRNLLEGMQGYLVRKTFIPNEELEEKFNNDKDVKDLLKNGNENAEIKESVQDKRLKRNRHRDCDKELEGAKPLKRLCILKNTNTTRKKETHVQDMLEDVMYEICVQDDISLTKIRRRLILDSDTDDDDDQMLIIRNEDIEDAIGPKSSKQIALEENLAVGERLSKKFSNIERILASDNVEEEYNEMMKRKINLKDKHDIKEVVTRKRGVKCEKKHKNINVSLEDGCESDNADDQEYTGSEILKFKDSKIDRGYETEQSDVENSNKQGDTNKLTSPCSNRDNKQKNQENKSKRVNKKVNSDAVCSRPTGDKKESMMAKTPEKKEVSSTRMRSVRARKVPAKYLS